MATNLKKGIFDKIREIKDATEIPSTSTRGAIPPPLKKRKQIFISDSDDDDTTVIYIPDTITDTDQRKVTIKLGFTFMKDTENLKWKTEMVSNLDISLLHCCKYILIEKELADGNIKSMKLGVPDCQLLVEAREELLEVFQDLLECNFEKIAHASFGSDSSKEIVFKRYEGMNVVDVREYYLTIAGERKPSKNGVMFNAERLPEVIEKLKYLLGFCETSAQQKNY